MATTTEDLLKQALEQNRKLMKQVQTLTEQVAYLNRKLYGSHSEKMTDPNQLSLLGDNSVFTDPEQTGQQSEEIVVVKAKRKPKSSRGESIDPKLPIEETVITRESELCDHGHQLTKVGKHLVREVVHHIPGRLGSGAKLKLSVDQSDCV
nr:transposase [Lacticaseibacillus paracasei]